MMPFDAISPKLFRCLIWIVFGLSACRQPGSTPAPQEPPLHLYLLAGQSNMAGRGVVEETDATSHPRVYALKADMSWGPATEPLHFDKPDIVGVGPGLSFGKAMAEADPSVRIGLIPAAVGGSPIRTWLPGAVHEQTNSRPYDDALSRTFRVIALHGGELKGVIWHQGESDRMETDGYEDALVSLVERFRKEFQNDSLPFVAAHLAAYFTETAEGASEINAIIDQLPARLSHTSVVTAEGFQHKGDGVHLDSPSARELGRRYAAAMLELQR